VGKTTKKHLSSAIKPRWIGCGLLLLSLNNGIALAVPPSNDTFAGATVVGSGFSETLDTTEATTDGDDAQLNSVCDIGPAPTTNNSVWYAYTPITDTTVIVDTSGSNFSSGILVGTGIQGNLSNVTCGPFAVSFFATAGTTYYVLAMDFNGGNGGLLNISFNELQATTLDDFTVNKFGSVNTKTGVATISGSYTCSHGFFMQGSGNASQKVGRVATIRGSYGFSYSNTCDGLPHPWSGDAIPQSGKFAGGKSMTVTFGFTCGNLNCGFGFVERTVQLRSNSK
jgi:hypothetical protein